MQNEFLDALVAPFKRHFGPPVPEPEIARRLVFAVASFASLLLGALACGFLAVRHEGMTLDGHELRPAFLAAVILYAVLAVIALMTAMLHAIHLYIIRREHPYIAAERGLFRG